MPVRRPRRIFLSQIPNQEHQGGMGRTVVAGVIGAMFGAFVVLLGLPSDLFGRVPSPSGNVTSEASGVAVVDGDTLRLRDAVIRLQGVEAPPRGRVCRRADGAQFDCGAAAVAALADLVRGRTVICHMAGRDGAGFTQGRCEAGETDLNRRLVSEGWARARADVPAFSEEEARARSEQRGLWRAGAAF